LNCQSQSNPPDKITIRIEQSRNPIQQQPDWKTAENLTGNDLGSSMTKNMASEALYLVNLRRTANNGTFNVNRNLFSEFENILLQRHVKLDISFPGKTGSTYRRVRCVLLSGKKGHFLTHPPK
jgi:hypothetical protein